MLSKDAVSNGEISYLAFYPDRRDVDGISLFLDKRATSCEFVRPFFGFLNVNAAQVRLISSEHTGSLKLFQDKPDHALIVGIPYFHAMPSNTDAEKQARKEAKKLAELLAQHVADQAAKIDEYEPNGFDPARAIILA